MLASYVPNIRDIFVTPVGVAGLHTSSILGNYKV